MRSATEILALYRADDEPGLQLAGEAHPDLPALAVVQPHRGLRKSMSAPDLAEGRQFPTVFVWVTPNREETSEYLALARRSLAPGGTIWLAAEKSLGADGWQKRLKPLDVQSKYHCKLMQLDPERLPNDGDPRRLRPVPGTEFVSCPGLFSWEKLDTGSELLLGTLPEELPGSGADFGCGPGFLARELLRRGAQHLDPIDVDRRAVEACRENCGIKAHWLDLTSEPPPRQNYDWITLNPPFHFSGREDRELGVKLLQAACQALSQRGELWLVANQDLPYEHVLSELGWSFEQRIKTRGYKVLRCQRNA